MARLPCVLLLLLGCGATSRSADGDSDTDADTDTDADDLDCTARGGPAGTVPVQACGPPAPSQAVALCMAEIGPCERDEQCEIVNFDDCCGLAAVAVSGFHLAEVAARVEPCNVDDPGCPGCMQTPSEAQCLDGQCALVECIGPCL